MLTLGKTGIVLAPEHGGAILGWAEGAVAILRPPSPAAVAHGDVHAMACFPMLPYCNRIAEGRFTWDGRSHRITRNFGDHPHAIHGLGWQRPWSVERVTEAGAVLMLRHDAAGDRTRHWPFAFDARVAYQLIPQGLSITLAVTNRHPSPAPMGIGLHPWFRRAGSPCLTFEAHGVWCNDDTVLPRRHQPIPKAWSHTRPRPIGGVALDNCFTAWNGVARIEAGPASLVIQAEPVFGHLQVFTPPNAGFFCVEPVSHVPDAINRPDLSASQAMDILAPDQTLHGTVTLTLTAPRHA